MKIITGEEVIGEITDLKDDKLKVEQPCAIAILPAQSTMEQHRMGLIPYAGYTKNHELVIDKRSIVWEAEPAEELYNNYNKIFGSGIQLIKKS